MKTTKMSKRRIYSKIERRTKRTKHTKMKGKSRNPVPFPSSFILLLIANNELVETGNSFYE